MVGQPRQQHGRRPPQEAGGKLVQQQANLFGRRDEEQTLLVGAMADRLGPSLRMFERTGELRQIGETDGRRAAGQGVSERDRRLADRAVQLHRPFGELDAQPT